MDRRTKSLWSDLELLVERERDSGRRRQGQKLLRQVSRVRLASLSTAVTFAGRKPTASHTALAGLLRLHGRKRHAPILLALLRNPRGDRVLYLEAGTALSLLRSERAVRRLIEIVSNGEVPDQREAAAYALAWYGGREAASALLRVLANQAEHPGVRGQAAEGLGYHFRYDPGRSAMFRRALSALLQALEDESAEIRFWAAFALGQLGSRDALPALQEVVRTDTTLLRGWGYVKDEALDAMARIRG